jgi:hypothetical protein
VEQCVEQGVELGVEQNCNGLSVYALGNTRRGLIVEAAGCVRALFFRICEPSVRFFTVNGATSIFWEKGLKNVRFSVLTSNPIRKTFFCTSG